MGEGTVPHRSLKSACILLSTVLGPGSGKLRILFGPEKPFVRFRFAYSVKMVFSCVVNGIKIKMTAKFRGSRRHHFEDTKRIMSHYVRPKSFGTFETRPRVSLRKGGPGFQIPSDKVNCQP